MSLSAELFTAIRQGDNARVKTLLATEPALAQSSDQTGMSPLITAIYRNQREIIANLVKHGAVLDLFAAAALGDTAWLEQSATERARHLDDYSADGWTALSLAAHFNQVEAVKILLEQGADLHARSRNANGNTALHAALAGGSGEVAGVLLERGADVNAADAGGWTPLHLAAANGRADLVRLVLRYQPFIDPENREGLTPLVLAERGGHPEVAALLRPHSAENLD